MRTPITAFAVALGACLLVAPRPVTAQVTLDTTIAVRSGARVELQNIAGSIEVRVTRRSEVRVRVEHERARIEVDATPGVVSVRTVPRRNSGEATYTVEVPAGTPLRVSTMAGDIDVQGVCGETDLHTMSGDVVLDCARGNVTARSASGEVTVSDVRGRLEANSYSGSVIVRTAQAEVAAQSISGDVTLDGVDGREVTAETVSGEVRFRGAISDGGRYHFQSHSGDVTVQPVGREFSATVTVNTFSGDLETDFPVTLTQSGRIRPREFEFTVGRGGARLSLSSFSGTIYLRRGAPGRED